MFPVGVANELDIYIAIKDAIIQQKLRPSMQLVEEVIAESFGVSRTPVRNVLRKLAGEKLVTVIPYKGTFVACPTVDEAKEVFEMRRVIEASSVKKASGKLTADQLGQLNKLLDEEHQAHHNGDPLLALRLSGNFHLKIAEFTGNNYYYRYLEELISLTYVIIALYGMSKHMHCSDHRRLVLLIEQGDAVQAERLMIEHLKEIEDTLQFEEKGTAPQSLSEVFRLANGHYASAKS
ncbi:GntR family transcriptional regulator [Paenibacillus sp. BIHB 4019]|uniref:GntR family transcriptional regulator n=1 Tax=Paenibacillus sp. BIHB 4019 TaxID=1870819 RepID=A0A1B2DI68_9BACL|nr:GntR family transcriptional regulator [Paenibacillus sp. BIHB 4019]